MKRADVDALDPTRTWWVPSVRAPERDWAGAPGCRRGARFLIDEASFRPARDNGGAPLSPGQPDGGPTIPCFESRALCLEWIMAHRAELARTAPGAAVAPADLARWLLGLA
jgi:hypothetical protein